jgi:DNA-binding IclR family transcriptional regulator
MYAIDEMKHLSAISEETVTLDILIGIQHFSLHEIPSKYDLRVTQESRMAGPSLAGASVKVLLSLLSDKQLKTALEKANVTNATDRTVTNKELLTAQVKEIRQQGYAISYGERIPGAMCISAPIKNYSLPVALSVVGPESRLQTRAKQVTEGLKASSNRISKNMAGIFKKGLWTR